MLFGEYGLIKQSVKEYFQRYPERKRISISQQQMSKAKEAKMKKEMMSKQLEDLVFDETATGNSLNIDSMPFKPRPRLSSDPKSKDDTNNTGSDLKCSVKSIPSN